MPVVIEVRIGKNEELIPTGRIGVMTQKDIESIFGDVGFPTMFFYVEEDFINFDLISNNNN
jgi:phenylalanyl-tRNA synthetase alpha subunit